MLLRIFFFFVEPEVKDKSYIQKHQQNNIKSETFPPPHKCAIDNGTKNILHNMFFLQYFHSISIKKKSLE